MAGPDVRPRWQQVLFIVLIIAGVILIAISVGLLISGVGRGNGPDALLVAPGMGLRVPA